LWTIGPEIKFYAIVPVFVYFYYRMRKYSDQVLFFFILVSIWIDYYNIIPELFRRNSIFFKASLFSLFYLKLQKIMIFQKLQSLEVFRKLMGFFIILVFFVMARKFSRFFDKKMTWELGTLSAEYYSLLLFVIVLVSAPNDITRFMETDFLKKLGQYSFGIHLIENPCVKLAAFLCNKLSGLNFFQKLNLI